MIDLDKIEQQCKGAIENGYGHLPVVEYGNAVKLMEVVSRLRAAESEIDELLSMFRQSEKDAARYRWLRYMAEVDGATEMMLAILISDDWDSAIDEAMNASNN